MLGGRGEGGGTTGEGHDRVVAGGPMSGKRFIEVAIRRDRGGCRVIPMIPTAAVEAGREAWVISSLMGLGWRRRIRLAGSPVCKGGRAHMHIRRRVG